MWDKSDDEVMKILMVQLQIKAKMKSYEKASEASKREPWNLCEKKQKQKKNKTAKV